MNSLPAVAANGRYMTDNSHPLRSRWEGLWHASRLEFAGCHFWQTDQQRECASRHVRLHDWPGLARKWLTWSENGCRHF